MSDPRLELDGEGLHAVLIPGRGTHGGYSLLVDGVTQSHVNPDDPRDLQLEYVRAIAAVVSAWRPGSDPLAALHLGAGGLTLPRYLAATRPGSRQHVVELHPDLFDFVLDALPLRDDVELTVEFDDARVAVDRAARHLGGYDLAIVDVFSGSAAPPSVGTVEFFEALGELQAPDALTIVNTLGGGDLELARTVTATLVACAPHVTVITARSVVLGGAPGNLVLVASASPLPVDALGALLAGEPRPISILTGDEVTRFADGAEPAHDEPAR
jgi:spermidine synthase